MQAKKQVQRPQHGIVYGKLEEPKDKFGQSTEGVSKVWFNPIQSNKQYLQFSI